MTDVAGLVGTVFCGLSALVVEGVEGAGEAIVVRARSRPGPVQTFREQVPGVLERYQRRTTRLTGQVGAAARELAGRASARLLPALGIAVSRHTAVRVLLAIPLPGLAVPRVPGPATSRCAAAWSPRPS